ncbi:MAG: SurA N-terminal domain-containing protein [Chloroflexota bacterium]|nr:SurA N-terminal domain-containing protein [Chloroflexota bacterium]
MSIFKLKIATRTSLVVLLVVAALITGGVAVGAGTFWSDDYQRGQATASESSEDDSVVATAGDMSISARELHQAVLHLRHMKQMAEKELQGLGEDADLPTDYLQDRHNLVIEWGDENAALASLIQEHVLHQKATELGHEVTDEELEESKEWAREAYERGELDGYTQGYIDSVGADHYWDNIYPALATRSMAIEKLYDGVAEKAGTQSHDEVRVHWHNFEEEVISAAEITVPESEEHSATLDGVMGFLDNVRETNRAHLRKDDDLPAAPDDTWVIHVKKANSETWEVIHHHDEPEVCTGEDENGNKRHHICDADGKVLAEIGPGDASVITPPGETLPIFTEDGPK